MIAKHIPNELLGRLGCMLRDFGECIIRRCKESMSCIGTVKQFDQFLVLIDILCQFGCVLAALDEFVDCLGWWTVVGRLVMRRSMGAFLVFLVRVDIVLIVIVVIDTGTGQPCVGIVNSAGVILERLGIRNAKYISFLGPVIPGAVQGVFESRTEQATEGILNRETRLFLMLESNITENLFIWDNQGGRHGRGGKQRRIVLHAGRWSNRRCNSREIDRSVEAATHDIEYPKRSECQQIAHSRQSDA